MRILLVEKEPEDRLDIKQVLGSKFEIIAVASSGEAVNYVQHNPIDVAVLNDNLIENLDGPALLAELRNKSINRFRAVALIAHQSEGQRKHLLNRGFQGVVQKPINVNHFLDVI